MTQHRQHNEAVLETLEEGDLVEFYRTYITHWGVYVGGGKIVHLCIDERSHEAGVKKEDFWSVAEKSRVEKNNGKDDCPFTKAVVKERALLSLGRSAYDILKYNCEHFANWCRYGKIQSAQADSVSERTGIVGKIERSVCWSFSSNIRSSISPSESNSSNSQG